LYGLPHCVNSSYWQQGGTEASGFKVPLGVTTSKAAFLNQRKQLSVDNKNEWQDVRIVVIDKVSFMSDTILKRLTEN
jgi:hypothetical protein